jgi:hypothetical protein
MLVEERAFMAIQYRQQQYTCLGVHVKCPVFLPSCYQILILWTEFRKISHYQISLKSFQWESRWYMRTDGKPNMKQLEGRF